VKAITMRPSEAWRIFQPELLAVTADNWTEEDYAEEPERRQLAADVEAGNITPAVLDEVEDCLMRDWCAGKVLQAALVVLAAHGRLEVHDPSTVTLGRRIATTVINGTCYTIGSYSGRK
jgi:hypothetical protein